MSEAVIKSISTLSHHRITYQPEDEGWIQKNEDVDVFLDVAATFAHDGARLDHVNWTRMRMMDWIGLDWFPRLNVPCTRCQLQAATTNLSLNETLTAWGGDKRIHQQAWYCILEPTRLTMEVLHRPYIRPPFAPHYLIIY